MTGREPVITVDGPAGAGKSTASRELARRLGTIPDEDATEEYRWWHGQNDQLLRLLIAHGEVSRNWLRSIHRQIVAHGGSAPGSLVAVIRAELWDLASLADRADMVDVELPPPAGPEESGSAAQGKVLVVYGRNEEVKEKIARFLMKLELHPVLLDEQAAHGRTLIEKLEAYAPVAFAVVLLTGDDIGALATEREALRPRARQNVIFELGFEIARLGRARVCVLYGEGVELPSDFHGIEYKPLDAAGAWKAKLAKELYEAGLRFDPVKAL